MGGKPRVSGGLLDGVNARLKELEARVSEMEEGTAWAYGRINGILRAAKIGVCVHSLGMATRYGVNPIGKKSKVQRCECLQCRLYRMVTEDSPVE